MARKLVYPEMREYEWAKDLARVTKASKFVHMGLVRAVDLPKVPVGFVLAVMREAASRREVMAAYGSAPLDGQIPAREAHLISWHNEYLRHKYGNQPDPVRVMQIPMRKLANSLYTGVDDPKLRLELLLLPTVCEAES